MVSVRSVSNLLNKQLRWLANDDSLDTNLLVLGLVFGFIWHVQPFIILPLNSGFYKESEFLIYEYFSINRLSFLIGCVGVSSPLFLNIKREEVSWSSVPKWIRSIIITCVVLLAWAYGFTETNYFYNKTYLADKIFLLILAFLTIRRPQFTFLFLLQAYLLSKQFAFALPVSYTFTDKQIIYDILFGFSVFQGLKSICFKNVSWHCFLIITLLILCNWYFKAGLGKIVVGWQNHNSLYNLFMASVAHDWLYQFPKLKLALGSILYQLKGIIEYLTLLVEFLFPLILLFRRAWFKYLMISFIIFHLLVYLTSGIFFWKWIVLEIILIVASYKWSEMLDFSWRLKLVYFFSLVLFFFLSPTTSLVWYDTPFVQKHQFSLLSDSQEIKLDASFFSPYDVIFAQNRFSFLSQRPTYTRTYGSTTDLTTLFEANDAVVAGRLPQFTSAAAIEYNKEKEEMFLTFVQEFANNKLKNDVKWVNWFDAPMHIHQGVNQQNFDEFNKARSLRIVYKELLTLPNLKFKEVYKDERVIKLQE